MYIKILTMTIHIMVKKIFRNSRVGILSPWREELHDYASLLSSLQTENSHLWAVDVPNMTLFGRGACRHMRPYREKVGVTNAMAEHVPEAPDPEGQLVTTNHLNDVIVPCTVRIKSH